jgi:glycosyltransferase involved in cell wall biosynthesis
MTVRPRPRILQIGKFYPPHMGGIETHLEALCSELRDSFDVRVAAANHEPGARSEIRDGIPIERLATPFSLGNAPVNPGLVRSIRHERPDLIHIHLPHPGGVIALGLSGYRGPVVATYHSDVVRQRIRSALFRPFLDDLLRRARAIVATSPAYLDTSAVLRRHRERCRVVPYGIPIGRFETPDRDAVDAIHARYGPRLVLAVGRLVYYKGFDVLIRAMASIDARLLVIGDGPLRSSLRELARAAGVAGKVSFVGELQNEDAAPYFTAASVFVLPSIARSEAFGIVQLEAMASGTPVVNTSLGSGVPWVSLHGVTGLTVPPGDPAALAAAIGTLLGDEALRRRFGAAARDRVRAEFEVSVMGNRIMRIYERALGSRMPQLSDAALNGCGYAGPALD